MNRRNFVIGAGGAITAGTVGSLAFTQASVERDLDVQVVTDDSADAALRFESSDGTTITEDGQLTINGISDHEGGGDAYLTPNGDFTFGDHSSPSTANAFTMTNQLASERTFDFVISGLTETDTDFIITLYDDTGSELGVADSETDLTDMSLASGDSAYGVIEIQTGGSDSSITGDVTVSGSDTTST